MAERSIKVPDIGEGIAEVEVVSWHVAVGDDVAEDQVVAEVMTDKASVEVPAPFAGRVLALGGAVGQMLAVGSALLRLETAAGPPAAQAVAGPPVAAAEPAAAASPAPTALPTSSRSPSAASPPQLPHQARSQATPAALRGARPIASPALRARAWELGIDLGVVAPTGTGGRIMQADLDAHVARFGRGAPAQAAQPAPTPRDPRVAAGEGKISEIPIVGLRRKIAQRMQESKRRIPHYSYVEEIDVGSLEALRQQLNDESSADRPRLTLLPFLVRAIVAAVARFPAVNAWLDDEAGVLRQHEAVHAGVATQTDAGLLVPVLRDAQTLDLWGCATAIARLADAARRGRSTRDELSGSTITITSLGKLGGIVTTPVINRPEVAIVGVNRIVQRPVVQAGAVVVRPMMNLSSSFDHRVVDGAVAAGFVQEIRRRLEQPALLFV